MIRRMLGIFVKYFRLTLNFYAVIIALMTFMLSKFFIKRSD